MGDDPLGTLRHVLASAAKIAQELAGEPLLSRLLDVFSRMPVEDREVVIKVLEREVDLRNLTRESPSGPLSGLSVTKPNPNSRLYLRVTDNDPVPYVRPDEIVHSIMRVAGIMHRAVARGTDLTAVWEPAMVSGLRLIGAKERETLRWYHRKMLELMDHAERAEHTG
jgi:hypothetical protein